MTNHVSTELVSREKLSQLGKREESKSRCDPTWLRCVGEHKCAGVVFRGLLQMDSLDCKKPAVPQREGVTVPQSGPEESLPHLPLLFWTGVETGALSPLPPHQHWPALPYIGYGSLLTPYVSQGFR